MDIQTLDYKKVDSLTEFQVRSELKIAITMIRKVAGDVTNMKKQSSTSYNKEGHMRCVNYLQGYLNVWGGKHGS